MEPENLFDFIMEHLNKKAHEDSECNTDPTKYPRYVEVTDDKALLMDAQLDAKVLECTKVVRKLEQLKHECAALKDALFNHLNEIYPQIDGLRNNTGIRAKGNQRFFVGWDK